MDLLCESIESFFKSKGFEIRKDALLRGYRFSITPRHVHSMGDSLNITILGHSDDFIIELLVSDLSDSSIKLGLSTILFGGGVFVSRGLKLQKALENLEKDFWVYVEEAVAECGAS